MRARWAVNLLLLILVALLATAAHWELEHARRVTILTELDPTRIETILLERPGEPAIRLVRQGERWRMESPYRIAADAARIAQLARLAATAVHRSLPQTTSEDLGLTPGRVLLTLDGVTLRFGDTDPIDKLRYVASDGQAHLIEDGFHHHLIAPAEDYVDRRLLPPGFTPTGGDLDGEPITEHALSMLLDLTADAIAPLGNEIAGRVLTLNDAREGQTLRLVLSADAHRWSRPDLRLTYLLSSAPPWAVAIDASGSVPSPPPQVPASEP